MTEYVLSGNGVQALPPRTSRVYVYVTTPSPGYSTGLANPVNYFHVGLLRFGEGGIFGRVLPIDGDACFFDVPDNCEEVGYSVKPGGVIHLFDSHP